MQVSSSMATPKNVVGLSVLLLLVAALFGVLNGQKLKTLRLSVAIADSARDAAEKQRLAEQKAIKSRESSVAATAAVEETRAAKAQEELTQLQTEKAELQTKLQANQAEVASLQRKIEEGTAKPADNPGAASPAELQAQLDDPAPAGKRGERKWILVGKNPDRSGAFRSGGTGKETPGRRWREPGWSSRHHPRR
jgi:septal ring factor EnvC (AmiA/AmiB activator)